MKQFQYYTILMILFVILEKHVEIPNEMYLGVITILTLITIYYCVKNE